MNKPEGENKLELGATYTFLSAVLLSFVLPAGACGDWLFPKSEFENSCGPALEGLDCPKLANKP